MTAEPAPGVEARPRRDRRLAIALAWGPVAVAAAVLFASGRAGGVGRAIVAANPAPLLILFCAGLILPVVHATRWRSLLRAVTAEVPLPAAVEMTITASLVNYALPGYTGSPAKGLLVRQLHQVGFGRSTPTLVAEQLLDALMLAAAAVLALALTGRSAIASLAPLGSAREAWVGTAVVVVVLVAAVGSVTMLRKRSRFLGNVVESARLLAADRAQRGTVLALTVVYWLLGLLTVCSATRAVGIPLGATALLWLASAPVLLGMLSPLPGGLGLREAAMAAVGGMLGLPVSGIVAAAVIQRGLLILALPVALAGTRLLRRSRGR
ncbi:MAG TPA: lysylphosphatidylglycerol synthase transmembrane domain-containing protein [Thermomicrobiaceae bacterium]|nr:lysylphosphatidylglycerol synthase transmembrane domain-containing protein [Thermomicrobiaceae bacterium]